MAPLRACGTAVPLCLCFTCINMCCCPCHVSLCLPVSLSHLFPHVSALHVAHCRCSTLCLSVFLNPSSFFILPITSHPPALPTPPFSPLHVPLYCPQLPLSLFWPSLFIYGLLCTPPPSVSPILHHRSSAPSDPDLLTEPLCPSPSPLTPPFPLRSPPTPSIQALSEGDSQGV